MPKKKPFTDRFEVMDCSKMHDGCYRIYARDGLKTVCLYLARPQKVGEFLAEEMVLSGLSEFSLEDSNLIGKRLMRFGTFIEDTVVHVNAAGNEFTWGWKFEFHSNVDEISKAYFRPIKNLLRRTVDITFVDSVCKITLRSEPDNHFYLYELGAAIERLKWVTRELNPFGLDESLELQAVRKGRANIKRARGGVKGTKIRQSITESHIEKILPWLKSNGYYPALKKGKDSNFLNRDELVDKILSENVLTLNRKGLKNILREIFKT